MKLKAEYYPVGSVDSVLWNPVTGYRIAHTIMRSLKSENLPFSKPLLRVRQFRRCEVRTLALISKRTYDELQTVPSAAQKGNLFYLFRGQLPRVTFSVAQFNSS